MGSVVCIGDSLTWGFPYGPEVSWVKRITDLYGYQAFNRGINGDTTGDMLERFARHVLTTAPDYVIITGGANDVFWRESIDSIVFNIQEMIRMAEGAGIKPVVGLTPPIDDQEMEARLKRLRKRLTEMAGEKQLQLIDFSPPFYAPDGTVLGDLFLDGAHPSREGYRLMGLCMPDHLL